VAAKAVAAKAVAAKMRPAAPAAMPKLGGPWTGEQRDAGGDDRSDGDLGKLLRHFNLPDGDSRRLTEGRGRQA